MGATQAWVAPSSPGSPKNTRMHHLRCPSSQNTSVKRTGARSPRGVLSSRTSKPLKSRTSSCSSPSPSLSTRESGLIVLRLPSRGGKKRRSSSNHSSAHVPPRLPKISNTFDRTFHQHPLSLSFSLSVACCIPLSRRGVQNVYQFYVLLLHTVSRIPIFSSLYPQNVHFKPCSIFFSLFEGSACRYMRETNTSESGRIRISLKIFSLC